MTTMQDINRVHSNLTAMHGGMRSHEEGKLESFDKLLNQIETAIEEEKALIAEVEA